MIVAEGLCLSSTNYKPPPYHSLKLNAIVIGIKVGTRVLNLGTTGPSNIHAGKYIFDTHCLGDMEDEDEYVIRMSISVSNASMLMVHER